MRVGFIGWRGLVGSVLQQRLTEEGDFDWITPSYFSTSNPGGMGPNGATLLDANSISELSRMPILVSCQGGAYTEAVYTALRQTGWPGFWVDAAGALRMSDEAALVLDPVNGKAIREAIASGKRCFVGANCTVSLMLLAIGGLINTGQVEWISSMTYQAASGAGAANMEELVEQMRFISDLGEDSAQTALALDREVSRRLKSNTLPTKNFGAPLAANLLPWIDSAAAGGQTREEWKGMVEANKLLGLDDHPLPIDGLCVRVGSMRSHAQALTIKLKSQMSIDDVKKALINSNPWVRIVENNRIDSIRGLTPAAVSGTLDIAVGRIRKMKMGPEYLTLFTVGDQLLWGAAEPLRRMLGIIRETEYKPTTEDQ